MAVPEKIQFKEEPHHWLFGNFTQSDFIDFLCLSRRGRTLFQYQKKTGELIKIHHDQGFSSILGWEDQHRASVKLITSPKGKSDQLAAIGPSGLEIHSFKSSTTQWELKISPATLSIKERYPDCIHVADKENLLLTGYSDEIMLFTVNEEKKPLNIGAVSSPSQAPIAQKSSLTRAENKLEIASEVVSSFSPSHNIDIQDLWPQVVNSLNGKAEFSIPLIRNSNLYDFNFSLFYRHSTPHSGLGVGWRLFEDCIISDDQDSAYYWSLNGNIIFLTYQKTVKDKEYYFIRGTESNIEVYYQNQEEVWRIRIGETERLYHSKLGPSKSWHIHQVIMRQQPSLKYLYSTSNHYLLTEIQDSKENKLILDYQKKEGKDYLSKIHLEFGNKNLKESVFIFNYEKELKNSAFLLKSITLGEGQEHWLSLDYKSFEKIYLEKINLQNRKNAIELFYQKISLSHLNPVCYTLKIHEKFQFNWIGPYILLSGIDRKGSERLTLTLLTQDSQFPGELKTAWKNKLENINISTSPQGIDNYQVFSQSNFFAILIKYNNKDQDLYLFCKKNKIWESEYKTIHNITDAKIVTGINFLVYGKLAKKIHLLTHDEKEGKFVSSNISFSNEIKHDNQLFTLTSTGEAFSFYDDICLWVAYQIKIGEWKYHQIAKIPGQITHIAEQIEKFHLDDSTRKIIQQFFYKNLIFFANHSIGMTRICEENKKLYCVIDLWILDDSYQMKNTQNFIFLQEDISDLSKPLVDGYTLNYSITAPFKIIVKDAMGKIETRLAPDDVNKLKQYFLFSLEKYIFVPSNHIACFGNHKIVFEEKVWKNINESKRETEAKNHSGDGFNLLLSDQFILSRDTDQTFKLYRQNHLGKKDKILFDFKVKKGQ